MNIWREVAQNVVRNEMGEADVEKRKVEDKQRDFIATLKKEEKEFEPVYFKYEEEEKLWKVKDLEWYRSYQLMADEEEEEVEKRRNRKQHKKEKRGKKKHKHKKKEKRKEDGVEKKDIVCT